MIIQRTYMRDIIRIPTASHLVLLMCAVLLLTLADFKTTTTTTCVSSFMHRPPIAFVGRSAPVRRLVKTTTLDSILLSPHGPQQHQKKHHQQQQAMQAAVMLTKLWTSSSSSSSTQQEDDVFVEAQDLDALQQLFSKYCDKEGLMSKQNLEQIPAIAQLLVRT
jgi:hypothetical protein